MILQKRGNNSLNSIPLARLRSILTIAIAHSSSPFISWNLFTFFTVPHTVDQFPGSPDPTILSAKYCSSIVLSACLTRHVQVPHSSVHVFVQCIIDSDGPV